MAAIPHPHDPPPRQRPKSQNTTKPYDSRLTFPTLARKNKTVQKGTAQTRVGRYSEPNRIYHVTTCTHDRKPVFCDFSRGRLLVHALIAADACGYATTLAFVVMPDHLHWLLQLHDDQSLSASVRLVKSRSGRLIRRASPLLRRTWQSGFYDRAIRREEQVRSIARYIIANPLRAGIVDSMRNYPLWDSAWA